MAAFISTILWLWYSVCSASDECGGTASHHTKQICGARHVKFKFEFNKYIMIWIFECIVWNIILIAFLYVFIKKNRLYFVCFYAFIKSTKLKYTFDLYALYMCTPYLPHASFKCILFSHLMLNSYIFLFYFWLIGRH